MESAIEKLKKKYSCSRTGGKGSVRRKRKTKIIAKMSKSDLLTIQISNLESSFFTKKTSKKCEITEDVPKLTTQILKKKFLNMI